MPDNYQEKLLESEVLVSLKPTVTGRLNLFASNRSIEISTKCCVYIPDNLDNVKVPK